MEWVRCHYCLRDVPKHRTRPYRPGTNVRLKTKVCCFDCDEAEQARRLREACVLSDDQRAVEDEMRRIRDEEDDTESPFGGGLEGRRREYDKDLRSVDNSD